LIPWFYTALLSYATFLLGSSEHKQQYTVYHSTRNSVTAGGLNGKNAVAHLEFIGQEFLEESVEQDHITDEENTQEEPLEKPELNIDDVMEEVTRLLEKRKE
jgi:hypothetical protein